METAINGSPPKSSFARISIALTRIILYFLPPVLQLLSYILIEPRYVAVLIFGAIISIIAIPAGISIGYSSNKPKFCYKPHDVNGLYQDYSLSTYLLVPSIFNFVIPFLFSHDTMLNILPTVVAVVAYLVGTLIGYIILKREAGIVINKLREITALSVYLFFLLGPWLSEAIIVTRFGSGDKRTIILILVCSCSQIVIAFHAGAKLFYTIAALDRIATESGIATKYSIWKINPFLFSTLFSGAYGVYMLIPWLVTNIVSSIFNFSHLDWWGNFLAYSPIFSFIMGAPIGSTIGYDDGDEEEKRKLIP